MRNRTGLGMRLAAAAICWLVTSIGAQAATRTWNGAGADALASNPTNWAGGVAPAAGDDIVLDATTNKNMTWDATAPSNVASWYQVGYAGTVTIATVYGSTGFTNFTIAGNCVISNGTWTHPGNTSSEAYCLRVTIGTNFTIASGGTVNVDRLGYGASQGPGKGSTSDAGGGHGGIGGYYSTVGDSKTYGSVTAPTNLGSGGQACSGGGAIQLTVSGSSTVNGTISANGNGGANNGGGAGGSIYLTTGTLLGTGTVQANGGTSTVGSGSGGGGRIAVVLTSGNDFDSVTMTAYGGSDGVSPHTGAAGTVYKQTTAQGAGKGTVTINNNSIASTVYTHIPPFTNAIPDEIVNAMVVVTNRAAVVSTTNATVGELLIYTNCSWTLTNWTVSVNKLEHSLEDATERGPGATNRVDHYDQILWIGRPPGTVFVVH